MTHRRNTGGPRSEASERVCLRREQFEADGWTLNVSRGGIRIVVEDSITVGADYDVSIGDGPVRPARVIWVRDEADGQIAGLMFVDIDDGQVPESIPGSTG